MSWELTTQIDCIVNSWIVSLKREFLSLVIAFVMKELLGYISRHHEDLEKSFSDEQKEIFEKFRECWSEYVSLAEAAIFEYAFKLGIQIAIETLK